MSEPQQSPPSAQVVAQEFVRQYYTMLNAAPDFLHRWTPVTRIEFLPQPIISNVGWLRKHKFYSHNSSFIHGEDQHAVTGQGEIHKKILSLNFNNCHARICQVDSQSSIAGSVVVQVIGELSNSGQPMRRFLQSFVLAPQAANKYYVHVDIFRYQDDYVSLEDGESVEEAGVEALETGEAAELVAAETETVTLAVQEEADDNKTATSQEVVDSGCETNKAVMAEVDTLENVADDKVVGEDKSTDTVEAEVKLADETVTTPVVVPTPAVVSDKAPTVTEPEKVDEPAPVVHAAVPSKPLTWAALASRNAGGASQSVGSTTNAAAPRPPAAVTTMTAPVRAPAPISDQKPEQLPLPPRAARPAPAQDERSNGSNGRVAINGSKDTENGAKRGPSAVPAVYNDNQQVFVGNLPQHLTDQELIEFFEQYGAVLDFRINRKTGGSQAGNNLGQKNFGFMAFESPDTVEKVLAARPIYMGKHRLNIEEKKPKEELAATRTRTPRFPAANTKPDSGSGVNRSATNGSGPRRGREFRNDARSPSIDESRTNQAA